MNNHSVNPHIEAAGLVCRCGDPVPDSAPLCAECDDPICTPCRAVTEDVDNAYHVACEETRNERAYAHSLDDFYGSSSPQTDRERGEIAARERGK